MSDCHFIHDNIDVLYGVEPKPVASLPKICTCGAALTYAESLLFVEGPFEIEADHMVPINVAVVKMRRSE